MRHTRRSTRISYVEPTMDDFIDEDEDNNLKNSNNMSMADIENQPIAVRNKLLMEQSIESTPVLEEEEEEEIVIKPRTRNLRINSHRDNSIENNTLDEEIANNQDKAEFNWEDYVSEDTLKHLKRYNLPDFPNGAEELVQNWKYQFFVAFCNNVCQSYITNVLYSIKPLWKEIKFDELVLLYELFNNDNDSIISNDDNEKLYDILKLKILGQFTNDKKLNLSNWDDKIQPFYSYEGKFSNLNFVNQFDILYQMIKYMELKNVNMKNYLINHMDIFQYPEYYKDANTQIIILPNFGTIIEKTKIIPDYTSTNKDSDKQEMNDYLVPIKLSNCTINYYDDDPDNKDITNLIHLDYSQEIDSYLQSIKIEYKVKSFNWLTFLDYLKNSNNFEIRSFCEIKLTQLLSTAQLIKQRIRQHDIDELMTRRKRSSRLMARKEEIKKVKVSNYLEDKIISRDQFLKTKQRPIQRYNKKLKEIIWNQLWYNFDMDWKRERTNRRSEDKLPKDSEQLTQLDWDVINHGMNFNTRIFIDYLNRDVNNLVVIGKKSDNTIQNKDKSDQEDKIKMKKEIAGETKENDSAVIVANINQNVPITTKTSNVSVVAGADIEPKIENSVQNSSNNNVTPTKHIEAQNILEIPNEFCINEEDMEQSLKTNVNLRGVHECDNLNWLFQCTCLPELKELEVVVDKDNKTNDNKISPEILEKYIVCCDQCNVWTHWDCQTTDTIYWLGQIQAKPQHFTQDDFPTVILQPSTRYRKQDKNVIYVNNKPDSQPQRRSTRLREEYENNMEKRDIDIDNDFNSDSKDNNDTTIGSTRPRDRIDHNRSMITFMCNYCLSELEDQMRSQFIPELVLVREKQKKSREDRERRKLKKAQKQNAMNLNEKTNLIIGNEAINSNENLKTNKNEDNFIEKITAANEISDPLNPNAIATNSVSNAIIGSETVIKPPTNDLINDLTKNPTNNPANATYAQKPAIEHADKNAHGSTPDTTAAPAVFSVASIEKPVAVPNSNFNSTVVSEEKTQHFQK